MKVHLAGIGTDVKLFLKIKDLIKIKIPQYQREIVYTIDQMKSFITNCIFKGVRIPHFTILMVKENNNKSQYLIDGLQRVTAIIKFMNNEFSVNIDGKDIYYSDLSSKDKSEIENYNVQVEKIKGTHMDGIKWIDNEQKRVSHTAGSYLYRHRLDSDICRMTHSVVTSTIDILKKYLDVSTMYGNYVINRDTDFYPYIAAIIAHIVLGTSVKELPTCYPDGDNKLYLEREDIKSILYDVSMVNSIIQNINSINGPYSLQILPSIVNHINKDNNLLVTESTTQPVITYCRAKLKTSKLNKTICGNKATYTNGTNSCCGKHRGPNTEFQ